MTGGRLRREAPVTPRSPRWALVLAAVMAGVLLLSLTLLSAGCRRSPAGGDSATQPPSGPAGPGTPAAPGEPAVVVLSPEGFPSGLGLAAIDARGYAAIDGLRVEVPPGKKSVSLWILNPFAQPKKISVRVADSLGKPAAGPIDMTPYAKGVTAREMPLASRDWGWTVGPYPHWGSFSAANYEWATEDTLSFRTIEFGGHVGQGLAGLADLKQGKTISLVNAGVLRWPTAVSPDGARVAFARAGYLVVRDLADGREKTWPMTKDPANDRVDLEMLSWSPDGRFLLGEWYPALESYAVAKLWALEWATGKLIPIMDERNHPYSFPAWRVSTPAG